MISFNSAIYFSVDIPRFFALRVAGFFALCVPRSIPRFFALRVTRSISRFFALCVAFTICNLFDCIFMQFLVKFIYTHCFNLRSVGTQKVFKNTFINTFVNRTSHCSIIVTVLLVLPYAVNELTVFLKRLTLLQNLCILRTVNIVLYHHQFQIGIIFSVRIQIGQSHHLHLWLFL